MLYNQVNTESKRVYLTGGKHSKLWEAIKYTNGLQK